MSNREKSLEIDLRKYNDLLDNEIIDGFFVSGQTSSSICCLLELESDFFVVKLKHFEIWLTVCDNPYQEKNEQDSLNLL